jgi:hypothetical protein
MRNLFVAAAAVLLPFALDGASAQTSVCDLPEKLTDANGVDVAGEEVHAEMDLLSSAYLGFSNASLIAENRKFT